jgi:hypothetical protein
MKVFQFLCILYCLLLSFTKKNAWEGKLVKGNRNAIFLIDNGERKTIPDFYTFTSLGFNVSDIRKIPDELLNSFPLGVPFKPIPAPPVFRPDDFMFHTQCEDPHRMINDLGLVPNMGDYMKFRRVIDRIKKHRYLDILALGGSITAGGYFLEFVRMMNETENIRVRVHNHGHGATEITCKYIF